jgi:hypothetical protein
MTKQLGAMRLVVIEVLSLMALGIYLANSRNDPDYSKARALLDHIRETIVGQAQSLPRGAQNSGCKVRRRSIGDVVC